MRSKTNRFRLLATTLAVVMMITLIPLQVLALFPETSSPGLSLDDFTIDHENERILADGFDFDSANPVSLMYSPKASSTARKSANEKWYPLYGNEVDISNFIPKSENDKVTFAFRRADDLGTGDVYTSRVAVTINGRPKKDNSFFKTAFTYDPGKESISVLTNAEYDYKVGISGWITNNSATSIPMPASLIPEGAALVIRMSASDDSFHSNEYKMTIPKSPAAPKVVINSVTKKITGLKNEYVWDTEQNGDYKNDFDGLKSIPYGILGRVLGDAVEDLTYCDENGNIGTGTQYETHFVLYVKATATAKKPASLVQKLVISKALL
ncbi:hypothetical protein FACS1894105_01660 [Clostridia bacterium]|nr:hypothetical protein FACS1894105_01330 [Clostridia bacterium]GHU34592.1 hypothetical protein FACS1894105_01660 [Clostridia bacterium]